MASMFIPLKRVDCIAFTGGIGENSARIRQDTTRHLHLLGIELDPDLNEHHGRWSDGRISSPDSRYPALVIPTNEELVIAREASRRAAAGTEHSEE